MISTAARPALLAALICVGSAEIPGLAVPAANAKCPTGTRAHSLDLERSLVRWRGTKFWGRGEHSGVVRFHGGVLCLAGATPRGGWLAVDMRSLEVTDIPASDPVPRRRLREHLKSEDFFHVAAHPEARFVLRQARRQGPHRYVVSGDLTVRGRSHPVTSLARTWEMGGDAVRAEARLEVDRHVYGVSYRGSPLRDDLVDDTFWLDIVVVARPGGSRAPSSG